MVARGWAIWSDVKEFPDAVALLQKLMREQWMDPAEFNKAGAARRGAIK
jgi:hypothetical protein